MGLSQACAAASTLYLNAKFFFGSEATHACLSSTLCSLQAQRYALPACLLWSGKSLLYSPAHSLLYDITLLLAKLCKLFLGRVLAQFACCAGYACTACTWLWPMLTGGGWSILGLRRFVVMPGAPVHGLNQARGAGAAWSTSGFRVM